MVSGSSSRKRNDSFDDEEEVDESIGFNVIFRIVDTFKVIFIENIQDIKQICPTVIILLLTLFIAVTVIPYAFSSVIK